MSLSEQIALFTIGVFNQNVIKTKYKFNFAMKFLESSSSLNTIQVSHSEPTLFLFTNKRVRQTSQYNIKVIVCVAEPETSESTALELSGNISFTEHSDFNSIVSNLQQKVDHLIKEVKICYFYFLNDEK